MQMVE